MNVRYSYARYIRLNRSLHPAPSVSDMRRSSTITSQVRGLSAPSRISPPSQALASLTRVVLPNLTSSVRTTRQNFNLSHNIPVRNYTANNMSATNPPALKALNYELLDELRRFWFEHVEDKSLLILPDMSVMKRFFLGGDEFDGLCVYVPTNSPH